MRDDVTGDPERLIHFVKLCAAEFSLSGRWGFQYANTCSKPRLDGFGGGAHVLDLATGETVALDLHRRLARRDDWPTREIRHEHPRSSHTTNFQTLLRAAGNGNLALMECPDAVTGEPRYVICAVGRDDGDFVFTPFGHLARRQSLRRLSAA